MEELIVKLDVEEGNKTGQPIATYCPGKKSRHLVFMPSNASVGQEVRVKLVDTGNTDKRSSTLYRGVPAPIEYTERWKDKSDGTICLVTVATDWLLQESEAGERDARQPATREGTPSIRTDKAIVWGIDLTTSQVQIIEVKVIPIETEKVEDGELIWSKVSEREEPGQPVFYPVARLETANCTWHSNRYAAKYEAEWTVVIYAYYQDANGESWHKVTATWTTMPTWWQQEQESLFPVCSCGRQRRDINVSDQYPKCELCRKEEKCIRCQKQPIKVTNINGRLICDSCLPYEQKEQIVASLFTSDHLTAIAEEAAKLQTIEPLGKELGYQVLAASLSSSGVYSSVKSNLERKWQGYQWYYFKDDGVYGSKFGTAALTVLQYLPQAQGNSLVELIAWILGELKPSDPANDFYLQTQVEGKTGVEPKISEDLIKQIIQKIVDGKGVLAEWLRGSEADRLEALEALKKAEAELTNASDRVQNLLGAAQNAMHSEEQDYALVLTKIQDAYNERARQELMDKLIQAEYTVCPICGQNLWDSDSHYHYCQQGDQLYAKGYGEDLDIKVSKIGGQVIIRLIAEYTNYDGYRLKLEISDEVSIASPDQVRTKNLWRVPSELEQKLVQQIDDISNKIADIQNERARDGRVELKLSDSQNPKGEKVLQAIGTFSGSISYNAVEEGRVEYENELEVHYTCRPPCEWSEEQPKAGQSWICTIAFQIGFDRESRPVIVVKPQIRSDRWESLAQRKAELEAELETERKRLQDFVTEAFDDDGNPQTIMAAAFAETNITTTDADSHQSEGSDRDSWMLDSDPEMARKGWYLCPKGHSEKIKNAVSGQKYHCGICSQEQEYEMNF